MVASNSLVRSAPASYICSTTPCFGLALQIDYWTLYGQALVELLIKVLGGIWYSIKRIFSNFNANVITSLCLVSVGADYYAFTKPTKWCFKPYRNACMASYLPSSGSTTTILLNAVMYSYTEPHCYSLCNLSLSIFLSSSGAY